MKKIILLFSVAILVLGSACKKTKKLSINLYVKSNLCNSAEDTYPPIVLSLIKPRGCESSENNYLVDLQLHRYDYPGLKTEALKIPLTGVNKTRDKLGTAGFEHFSGEYQDNAPDFKATDLLFTKNDKPNANAAYPALSKKLSSSGKLLVVGSSTGLGSLAEKALKITSTVDSLEMFLEAQICSGTFDEEVLHVIFNEVVSEAPADFADVPTPVKLVNTTPVTTTHTEIEKALQAIGDIKTDPDKRMAMIDGVLSTYFSDDADIKEFSKKGTMLSISSAKDYLEKIALYKSMEKLEVKEALKKEDGKYWEVQVVEYHLHNN